MARRSRLNRGLLAGLAAIDLVVLVVAVAWFAIVEIAWVDHRPVCSGMAMQLRPELAGACFTGPRPFLVDGAAGPAVIAALAFMALLALVRVGAQDQRGS